MSTITNLIAKHTSTTQGPAKVETERFMLVITQKTREDLRTACEKLGAKQISFASEIFTLALADAMKVIEENEAKAKATK